MRGRRLSPERRARRLALVRTVEFVVAFLVLSAWLYVAIVAPVFGGGLVAAGFSFLGVQTLLILAIMTHVLVVKTVRCVRRARSLREAPELRAYLAAHVAGRTDPGTITWWIRRRRRDLEECLVEFLPAVTGRRRDALVKLAVRAGLVDRWQRAVGHGDVRRRLDAVMRLGLVAGSAARDRLLVALDDPLRAVRVEAARALLRVGVPDDTAMILRRVVQGPAFDRIVLADHLRHSAGTMVTRVLPALREARARDSVATALEMLASWRVSIAFPEVATYLVDADPRVATAALRCLPYVGERDHHHRRVLEALTAQSPEIRAAAAFAAGRLGIEGALEVLRGRLRDPSPVVALEAARALGLLGAPGRQRLEAALVDSDRRGAGAAIEALEHARLDRLRALAA